MKKIICIITVLTLVFSLASCKKEEPVKTVYQTNAHISASATSVALLDGELTVEGTLKNIASFDDVSDVLVLEDCIIAIRNDGSLDVKGELNKPLEEIRTWTDIVKLSGTSNFMAGLKKDGTVVAAGADSYGQCEVSQWKDIVDIAASGGHTVGLKKDKTCVATGRNDKGQCELSEFKNIKSIAAGQMCTIGIKEDGTAVAAGNNRYNLDDIKFYKNIKEVSVRDDNGIILQNDGQVRFFGLKSQVANPGDWQNIIKVYAAPMGYYAIDSTGSILYVGDSSFLEQNNGSAEMVKSKATVEER